MPTYWSKERLIVMEEVAIAPPYGVEEVVALRPGGQPSAALARVKRVLEGERKKLGLQ